MRPHSAPHAVLLLGQAHNIYLRVEIRDALGAWVDYAEAWPDTNWLREARVAASIDQLVMSGSVTLLREHYNSVGVLVSLAPSMSASSANVSGPAVQEGRRMRILVNVTANGVAPVGGDWVELVEGEIDELEYGKKTPTLTLYYRDIGARLLDLTIQQERAYGSNDVDVPMADVLQAMIADNWDVPTMGAAPVLYEPVPIVFGVAAFRQPKKGLLEALNDIAAQAGLVVRYKYDAAHVFRLTLYEPERTKVVPDAVFTPGQYIDLPRLNRSRADVRNQVRTIYTDVDGIRQSEYDEDAGSVAAYGPRYMELGLDVASLIRTSAQAIGLNAAALSDLSTPLGAHDVESFLWWPAELGDLYGYAANDRQYDAQQNLAVLSFEHVFTAPGKARTTIVTRGKVAGGIRSWVSRGDVGRRPPVDATYLVNLREGDADTTTQAFDWDASQVHTVDVYVREQPKVAVTNPYPDPDDPLDPPDTILLAVDVENLPYSLPVLRPTDPEDSAFVMLVPRDKAGNKGRIEYLRVEYPDADLLLPTITLTAVEIDPITGLTADLTVSVVDLALLGGTLYAYLNHGGVENYVDGDPEDGEIVLAATPALVDQTDDWDVGLGTLKLLESVRVHASRGKRIAFRFVNTSGLDTGLVWFVITGGGGVIDENGNLRPGSILNAQNFAAGIQPVEVYPAPLPALPNGTIVFNTTDQRLYKRQAGAWVAIVNAPDLTGQVVAGQIAATSIYGYHIVGGTILAGHLSANSVIAGNIAAGAINATAMFADAVVVSAKLSVAVLSQITDNAGIIVNGRLENIDNTTYIDLSVSGSSSSAVFHHPNFDLFGNGNADFGGIVSGDTFTASRAYFSLEIQVGTTLLMNGGQAIHWGGAVTNPCRITGGAGTQLLLRAGHALFGDWRNGGQPNVHKAGYFQDAPIPGIIMAFGAPTSGIGGGNMYYDGDLWFDQGTSTLYVVGGGTWYAV